MLEWCYNRIVHIQCIEETQLYVNLQHLEGFPIRVRLYPVDLVLHHSLFQGSHHCWNLEEIKKRVMCDRIVLITLHTYFNTADNGCKLLGGTHDSISCPVESE